MTPWPLLFYYYFICDVRDNIILKSIVLNIYFLLTALKGFTLVDAYLYCAKDNTLYACNSIHLSLNKINLNNKPRRCKLNLYFLFLIDCQYGNICRLIQKSNEDILLSLWFYTKRFMLAALRVSVYLFRILGLVVSKSKYFFFFQLNRDLITRDLIQ